MRDFEQDRRICEEATAGKWEIRYPEEYQGENEPPAWNGEIHVFVEGTDSWVGLLGYNGDGKENADFLVAAREGWPAALDEIESLKRQLQAAALSMHYSAVCPWHELSMGCEQEPSCNKNTSVAVDCWLEYWQSGTFQNGNNHGTTSKRETVGEGEK